MDEEGTRGQSGQHFADSNREVSASSGWVTTKQAARSLGISPRTVRWHIEQGQSTLEEQLATERQRREQAERERDELRLKLERPPEPRDVPETVPEGTARGEVPPEAQEATQRRSWLHRFFFGP